MPPMNNNRITLYQAIFFRVLASNKTSNAPLHPMAPSDTYDSTDLRQPPKTKSFSQIHLVPSEDRLPEAPGGLAHGGWGRESSGASLTTFRVVWEFAQAPCTTRLALSPRFGVGEGEKASCGSATPDEADEPLTEARPEGCADDLRAVGGRACARGGTCLMRSCGRESAAHASFGLGKIGGGTSSAVR